MTDASLHSDSWWTRATARLAFMAPAWFVVVMGWCGLAQAWLRAEGLLGEWATALGWVAAGVALVVFSLLSLASVVRLQVHPDAVHADLLHPVRHAFMAAFPISVLLLATLGVGLLGGHDPMLDRFLTVVWCAGSVLELLATWWVLSRWLRAKEQRGLMWQHYTPALFIPVVGNVLAPLGGVTLGLGPWATAQLGVGLFLWPVLVTLLIVRMVEVGPLPARMTPTLFVTLAPPAVVGLSLMTLNAPIEAVWAIWGMGLFFLGWALTQAPALFKLNFGMAHWGMSFPTAAFTALTLRLAQTPQGAWLGVPALVMLGLMTLLILGLTLHTWRGLVHGTLLVPEH
jgi:tellurite resistance protein